MQKLVNLQISDIYIDPYDINDALRGGSISRLDFTCEHSKHSKSLSLGYCKSLVGVRYRWHEWNQDTGLVTQSDVKIDEEQERALYKDLKEKRGVEKLTDYWWTLPLDLATA